MLLTKVAAADSDDVKKQKLLHMFTYLDVNGDGSIEAHELKRTLT